MVRKTRILGTRRASERRTTAASRGRILQSREWSTRRGTQQAFKASNRKTDILGLFSSRKRGR